MNDITICVNKLCKLKDKCNRQSIRVSGNRLSYSHFVPDWKTGKCDYFIEIKSTGDNK